MDKDTLDHILNVLRKGTLIWHGRNECLNRNRRRKVVGQYKNGKEKSIWERQCDDCGLWFPLKDGTLEVDHIVEVGPFNGNFDDYVRRMYCGQENLQALCYSCHKRKTSSFNSTLKYKRKNQETVMDSHDYL